MIGVRKFDEHNCIKKGHNIYAWWNPENPLHTAESREKYFKDRKSTRYKHRQQTAQSADRILRPASPISQSEIPLAGCVPGLIRY